MSTVLCSDCGTVQGSIHGELCSKNPNNTTAKLLLLILEELKNINSSLVDVESAIERN